MRGTWPRSFWYSVGLIVVFNSLFLALVLVKPGTYHQFVIADDVGQALGWLLATLLCFLGLEKPWRRTRSHPDRSEEHTSELQSHLNLVCRLLLEKKKNEL